MSVSRKLAHIQQVIRELRIADRHLYRVDLDSDRALVQLSIEDMSRVLDQCGRAAGKKMEYTDGFLHVSFEARAIKWVACRKVDLQTAERIQAAMGDLLELKSPELRLVHAKGGA